MLGVVLFSEYNELIHAFGNDQFRRIFFAASRSYSEGHGQLSNSSGISSTSGSLQSPNFSKVTEEKDAVNKIQNEQCDDAPTNSNTDKKGAYTVEDEGKLAGNTSWENEQAIIEEESLLLQQLMPLVALYRARGDGDGQLTNGPNETRRDGGHQIQCIQSGEILQVRIGNLPFSNLLMLIHAQSIFPFSSDRLFTSLVRCIDFHYGPQIQLIPLDSPHIQQLRRHCEQRMLRILSRVDVNGADKNRVTSECQLLDDQQKAFNQDLNFGDPHRFLHSTLIPRFQELCTRAARHIGRRVRCLFLHTGRLLASCTSHSPGETVLDSIPPHQLLQILQFSLQKMVDDKCGASSSISSLKCQTEQTWLHSKTLRRRQLYNLFVLSLSEHMEMVCIAPAGQFQLIGCVVDGLELLEQIGNECCRQHQTKTADGQILSNLLEKCQRHLERACRLLVDSFGERNREMGGISGHHALALGGWPSQWDYLYDVHKTGQLIMHLWTQFRTLLQSAYLRKQSSSRTSSPSSDVSLSMFGGASSSQSLLLADECSTPTLAASTSRQLHHQQYNNSTISSIYSTLEWSSLSATTRGISIQLFGAQIEAQCLHLKSTLRALLNELFAWSSGLARTQTLVWLQKTVRHFIGHQLADLLRQIDVQISRQWAQGDPLRPAQLGLDMLAYRFTRTTSTPLYFDFASDDQRRALLAQIVEAFPVGEMEMEDEAEGEEEQCNRTEIAVREAIEEREEIMVARTNDGQLIIQLKTRIPEIAVVNTSKKRKLLSLTSPFGKLPFGLARLNRSNRGDGEASSHLQPQFYHAIVIFSRHVNTALAMKQTQKLMNFLAEQMASCQRCFD